MTTAFWFTFGQTVVFLAVCGFALWTARVVAEAADNSARAAENAVKAAEDAERTAADMRAMRDTLRTWLDQQQSAADLHRRQQTPGDPLPTGRVGTDTAESGAVLTPQAIIDRGDPYPDRHLPADGHRSHRGRHARAAESSWTTALRAAASRTGRDK